MKGRKTWVVGIVVVLLGSAALALFLWYRSTERGFALLRFLPPEADLYLMTDLESLQTNPGVRSFLADPPQVSVEEDYKRFVEATDFRYQDDLRQMALARLGANWVGAARVRWDRDRILRYLETERTEGTEKFERTAEQGQTVFVVGRVRPLRLALPEEDLAIFTVGEDGALMRQALQRRSGEVPDSGAIEFARAQEGNHLSPGDVLWLIGRMDRLLSQDQEQPQIGPFSLGNSLLRGSKTLYASVRSRLTQLEFRVEDRCEDAAAAERIARTLQSLLAILRAVPANESNPAQANLSVLLKDISVQQVDDSVLVEWQWDAETLRSLK